MTVTSAQIIEEIIEREGGYSDRAADRGGPTNWGVTITTLRRVRGNPSLTAQDVKRLTKDEARIIYHEEFIKAPGFDLIPHDTLRTHMIDFGVNSSPARSIRYVQRIVGVKEDGRLGPVTLAAIKRMGYSRVNNLLAIQRILHLARLVRDDARIPEGTNAEFIYGWDIRATDFFIP